MDKVTPCLSFIQKGYLIIKREGCCWDPRESNSEELLAVQDPY